MTACEVARVLVFKWQNIAQVFCSQKQKLESFITGETQMQPTNQMLEEENTNMETNLSNKVKALKHLTIDIGTEVRTHNKLLSEMDDDFDSSGGLLESSIARVKAIAKTGGWRFIFYLILFSFFVFFVCYMVLKFR